VRTAHRAHPSNTLHRTTERSSERSNRNGQCGHPVAPRARQVAPKNGRPCCSPSATGRRVAVNRPLGPSEVDCEGNRPPVIPIQETHTQTKQAAVLDSLGAVDQFLDENAHRLVDVVDTGARRTLRAALECGTTRVPNNAGAKQRGCQRARTPTAAIRSGDALHSVRVKAVVN